MRRIPINIQLMTFIILLAGLCVLIIGAVLLPSVQQFRSMHRYITTTQQYLEQQYTEGKTITKSLQHISDIQKGTAEYENGLLEQGQELELITKIESIANGHIDQKLSVQYHEKEPKLKRKDEDAPQKKRLDRPYYTFSFVNRGTHQELMQYMHSIEQLEEYLIIDKIRWEREPKATTSTPTTILRFDARVYEKRP